MPKFNTIVGMYCESSKELDLQKVWHYDEVELCSLGKKNLEFLYSVESLTRDKYWDLCWTLQGIMEFQDLQKIILPHSGKFLQQNYCFFESLNVLREAFLAGINSCTHISIAGLRSALEFILAHSYWESLKQNESDFKKFYSWLGGEQKSISFKELYLQFIKKYDPPQDWQMIQKIIAIYEKLCSYSHKPLLNESVTLIKESNLPVVSPEILSYWVDIAFETAITILHILIAMYPMSLYPVDILLKFGFNTPTGCFFDKYNAVPLQRALGGEKWNAYRKAFEDNDDVRVLLQMYRSKRDLSITEILDTVSEEDKFPSQQDINSRDDNLLIQVIVAQKAKMRSNLLALTYWVNAEADNFDVKIYKQQ